MRPVAGLSPGNNFALNSEVDLPRGPRIIGAAGMHRDETPSVLGVSNRHVSQTSSFESLPVPLSVLCFNHPDLSYSGFEAHANSFAGNDYPSIFGQAESLVNCIVRQGQGTIPRFANTDSVAQTVLKSATFPAEDVPWLRWWPTRASAKRRSNFDPSQRGESLPIAYSGQSFFLYQ